MIDNPKIHIIFKLLRLSIIFHAIYIGLVILMIAFQVPISKMVFLSGLIGTFIFPTILFTFDIIRFTVHVVFAVLIMRQLKNNEKSTKFEISSMILYGGLFSFIYTIVKAISQQYIVQQQGIEYMSTYIRLISIFGIGGDFYRVAITLLIIACAMSWYYKKHILMEDAISLIS